MVDTNYWQWYNSFIDNLKKKLELQVISIYVVPQEKKQELIDLIVATNDIDILMEIWQKIDNILKELWTMTISLLEKADKSVLVSLQWLLQKEVIDNIKEKEKKQEFAMLDELELNLDALLETV